MLMFRCYEENRMKFKQEVRNGVSIAYLKGELDLQMLRTFNLLFEEFSEQNVLKIVLDFGEVSFIDSQSLTTIITKAIAIRKKGGDIKISRIAPPILRVFELVRMKDIIDFYPDTESAIEAFS